MLTMLGSPRRACDGLTRREDIEATLERLAADLSHKRA